MNYITLGLVAHVDAGKTTLSEAILYESKVTRTLGRVDNGDTMLDCDELERNRGITIFSKQAVIDRAGTEFTILDTPGHVDFAAEMERTLQVLDYAVLVISASDGIQAHTKTLWRLLREYKIPVFLFINKMDQPDNDQAEVLAGLHELSERFVAFNDYKDGVILPAGDISENIAVAAEDEALLNTVLEGNTLPDDTIRDLVKARKIFPCYFGSALKNQGVSELLDGLDHYTKSSCEGKGNLPFGARVYKITRDDKGSRISHIRLTQGQLSVRDTIQDAKITQLRIYNGTEYTTVPEVHAGQICAVLGLEHTKAGDGLGDCADNPLTCIEPVITYSLCFEPGISARLMYAKLKDLDEELPELHLLWEETTESIQIMLMGPVQIEILTELIKKRCGTVPIFDSGKILYKETLAGPVIGVGHFEPLRHYAEAHIRMEPAEPGSGVDAALDCSEDVLAKNWQRLIYTHLLERTHRGTKIGAPLTDVHFTVINGKAHNKHTEGGDFRQAVYRAVRQGLMEAGTIILEPEYDFVLTLPAAMIGRAMTDLESMYAVMDAPEQTQDTAVIRGHGPVSTLRDYQLHVRKYTRGLGDFSVSFRGYMPCHNEEEVIAEAHYDPDADQRNPSSSVFCSHGSGYLVPWDQVKLYMHVQDATETSHDDSSLPATHREHFDASIGLDEIEAILSSQTANKNAKKQVYKKKFARQSIQTSVSRPSRPVFVPEEQRLIVDGYNVIFAWDELSSLAKTNLDSAKDMLTSILSNYQGMTDIKTILVFDGYKVKGNHGSRTTTDGVEIIHTKENQTADQFIESYTHENASRYNMTVVTSDGLIQTVTRGAGCHILSSRELYDRIEETANLLRETYHIE